MDDEAATLAASVAARIGCIQAAVDKLQRRLPGTDVWVSSAEVYTPATNSWVATGPMAYSSMKNATANLLPNGTVLVAGGSWRRGLRPALPATVWNA